MSVVNIAPNDLLSSVYDGPFDDVTAAALRAIVTNSTGGIADQRIRELEAEIERLAAAGRTLTIDNPVVRALLADLEPVMAANASLVQSVAADTMLAGVIAAGILARQLALPGLTDDDLLALGIPWTGIDPVELASALGYVDSPAWQAQLAEFSADSIARVQDVIIQGIAQGLSADSIARDVRTMLEGVPKAQAQQMLRTLQLVSSRDAQQVHRVANSEILEYQIRIAALDARTCMACVAQHGDILPIDARIDDHHNGRCTSVTKVVGFPEPDVTNGVEWFDSLSDAQQKAQMGNAGWDAWKAGAFDLRAYIRPYDDPVFGNMIGTDSLAGILGAQAQEFKQ